MTSTVTAPTDPSDASDLAPDPVALDVRVLDANAVLEEVVAHRAAAEASEARVLMLAVHYVDLHPVTPQHPAATAGVQNSVLRVRDLSADPPTPDARTVPEGTELLAGEGTPGIAEYAIEELGAVLGVPYLTAYGVCADAVAVCYRLPRIWGRVHAGLVPAWRAKQVAREARGLSAETAEFVDRQVAILIDRRRFPTLRVLRDLVHEARLRMDPDHEQKLEEKALANRGVWFDHQTSTTSAATTDMSATLDAWDALELDAALTGFAHDLRAVGDTRDLDVLRAEALAMLANPQRVLGLGAAAVAAESTPDSPVESPANSDGDADGDARQDAEADAGAKRTGSTAASGQRSRPSVINLYVHASLADLARAGLAVSQGADPTGESPADGSAGVERFGPMLLSSLRTWLDRADRVVVRPVLDPIDPNTPATRAVDQHDPPPAMRDLVILRDGQCVFPGCRVDARSCDLDHIVAYLDPDEGGPPGQTRPRNLACLCRRHHRLKTFTGWDYQQHADGSYTWVSPRGQTFITHPLPKRAPSC